MPELQPALLGATVVLPVAIPRATYATLLALASADAGCSVDWLASFALRDFARHYAAAELETLTPGAAAGEGVRRG